MCVCVCVCVCEQYSTVDNDEYAHLTTVDVMTTGDVLSCSKNFPQVLGCSKEVKKGKKRFRYYLVKFEGDWRLSPVSMYCACPTCAWEYVEHKAAIHTWHVSPILHIVPIKINQSSVLDILYLPKVSVVTHCCSVKHVMEYFG